MYLKDYKENDIKEVALDWITVILKAHDDVSVIDICQEFPFKHFAFPLYDMMNMLYSIMFDLEDEGKVKRIFKEGHAPSFVWLGTRNIELTEHERFWIEQISKVDQDCRSPQSETCPEYICNKIARDGLLELPESQVLKSICAVQSDGRGCSGWEIVRRAQKALLPELTVREYQRVQDLNWPKNK